ncbi:MAG: hypothetical protein GY759_02990 [Chloroflexi bacterium]|nr:hypothetical protein [Chloroflexota bacterium]
MAKHRLLRRTDPDHCARLFVNMYSTHRLLAATKKQQIATADGRFVQIYHQWQELDTSDQDTYSVAMKLNAWAVVKYELMLTRSWPYNTEMLRTLFITVLIPVLVSVARLISPLLSSS